MPKANTVEETKRRAEKAAATREFNKAAKEQENVLKNEERVVKSDMEPARADVPAADNNNMAVNKPMASYNANDASPIRREATPEEEAAHVGQSEEEPRRLIIGDGPGNLMIIKWNRGGGQIPKNCWGGWNNKQKAMDAIRAAHEAKDFDETQLQEAG